MVRKRHRKDRPGALLGCEIELSSWLLNAIEAINILTLHPDYFRLRRPLDRRLYQIGRKHCGLSADRSWEIGLKKLHARSGSIAALREFRRLVKEFAGRWRGRQFLDYEVDFDPTRDIATFTALPPVPDDPRFRPVIEGRPSPAAMGKARGLAPGATLWSVSSARSKSSGEWQRDTRSGPGTTCPPSCLPRHATCCELWQGDQLSPHPKTSGCGHPAGTLSINRLQRIADRGHVADSIYGQAGQWPYLPASVP